MTAKSSDYDSLSDMHSALLRAERAEDKAVVLMRRQRLAAEVLSSVGLAITTMYDGAGPATMTALVAYTTLALWCLTPDLPRPPVVTERMPEIYDAAEQYIVDGNWDRFNATMAARAKQMAASVMLTETAGDRRTH